MCKIFSFIVPLPTTGLHPSCPRPLILDCPQPFRRCCEFEWKLIMSKRIQFISYSNIFSFIVHIIKICYMKVCFLWLIYLYTNTHIYILFQKTKYFSYEIHNRTWRNTGPYIMKCQEERTLQGCFIHSTFHLYVHMPQNKKMIWHFCVRPYHAKPNLAPS